MFATSGTPIHLSTPHGPSMWSKLRYMSSNLLWSPRSWTYISRRVSVIISCIRSDLITGQCSSGRERHSASDLYPQFPSAATSSTEIMYGAKNCGKSCPDAVGLWHGLQVYRFYRSNIKDIVSTGTWMSIVDLMVVIKARPYETSEEETRKKNKTRKKQIEDNHSRNSGSHLMVSKAKLN